jgi:hypothetical protein
VLALRCDAVHVVIAHSDANCMLPVLLIFTISFE